MEHLVILLEVRCRAPDCCASFLLCPGCYRGQRYCGPACRTRSRRQQHRAANARYQQTEAGRLDHNDRQIVYRDRQRAARVTDLSSPQPDSASSFHHDAPTPVPAPPAALPGTGLHAEVARYRKVSARPLTMWVTLSVFGHSRRRRA